MLFICGALLNIISVFFNRLYYQELFLLNSVLVDIIESTFFVITGSTADLSGVCVKEEKLKHCPHFHLPTKVKEEPEEKQKCLQV